MKTKNLMMTAIAALAIAGCSQNEVMEVSPDSNPAVGFDVYTGAQTKGTVADNTSIKTGFGVLAYFTGNANWAGSTEKPNFMYNPKVAHSGFWVYSPRRFWPKNTTDKITFFAYAPYESAPDAGTNKGIVLSKTAAGNPKIDFTLKAADSMVDLVTDETQKDKTKASTSDGTVAFKFKHILSRVKLMAKAGSSYPLGIDIVIKEVKILGKASHSATKFYSQAVYTTNLSSGNGSWAAGTQAASDYDLKNILDVKETGITDYTPQGIKLSVNEASLFKSSQYLFFIPVANFAKGDIKVQITYDVVTEDTSDDTKTVKSENTDTVDLPAGILEKGKAYKFTFTIGLDVIDITGEIDASSDWGTESTGNLTN